MNQFSLFAQPEPSIEGIDKGAAHRSYRADLICDSKRIRKPVRCNGDRWVNLGGVYYRGTYKGEMYRLCVPEEFDGSIIPEGAGYYHGMAVKYGTETLIICEPSLPFALSISELQDSEKIWHRENESVEEDDSPSLFEEDAHDENPQEDGCEVCGEPLA